MTETAWLPGLAAVLIVTGAFLVSGAALRRLLLRGWSGPSTLLATLVLAVSSMIVVATALGVIGLLTRPALIIAAIFWMGASWLALRWRKVADGNTDDGAEAGNRHFTAPVWIALGTFILVSIEWIAPTLNSLEAGMYGGDTLWYHMPFSAHFAQTGSITDFVLVDTQYLNWFYPQNSELIHAVLMVLVGSDFLSPVVNYFWLGLGILAGWCIGRPFGSALPASLSVSLLMAMETISARQPGNANNDAMVVALILAAVALAVTVWADQGEGATSKRLAFPEGPVPALAVAGLALGLAAGAKLTALAPALVLLIGFVYLLGPGRRLIGGSVVVAAAALSGGFWFARNLIATGNPFPWLSAGPLERAGELTGREPKPVIDYLTDPSVWSEWLAPGLSDRLGPFWLALLLAAIVGLGLGLASKDRLRSVVAAAGVFALVAYLLIPLGAAGPDGTPTAFSVNVRYLTPALALGFVSLALPVRFVDPRTWFIGVSWFFLLAFGISFIAAGGLDPGDFSAPLVCAAGFLVFILPIALAVFWSLGSSLKAAAIGVVWVTGLAVLGSFQFDRYTEFRYSSDSPRYPDRTYPAAELALGIGPLNDLTRNLEGERIGLSGSLAQYYQYGVWGPRASNEVEAVGLETESRDLNAPRNCRQWIEALREGDYDLVVTSPPVPDRDPLSVNTASENGWIGPDSARLLLESGRFAAWEIDEDSIDPRVCTASRA